jgi:hypothetical protein
VLLASEDVVYGYFFSLSYTVGGLRAIGAVGWSIQGTVKSTWLPAELMQIWYHDKDYWVC